MPAPALPAVFVGRTTELERVDLASRHVRLVVTYGVGGIGKTAFMMKAAHQLATRVGGHLVHHDCRAGESPATLMRSIVDSLQLEHADKDVFGAVLRHAATTPVPSQPRDFTSRGPADGDPWLRVSYPVAPQRVTPRDRG